MEVPFMKKKVIELPAMFGDHHVTEVRRILNEMQGVKDVYASSGFRVVEIEYDEDKVSDQELQVKLDDAGYSGELETSKESEKAESSGENTQIFLRHTAAYEQTKLVVGFGQYIGKQQSRPLWPCPGMGPIRYEKEVD
jgi:copper chaperone CopZ